MKSNQSGHPHEQGHDHSHDDNLAHAQSTHDHDHDDHEHDDHSNPHSHHHHDESHHSGLWGWVATIFHLHGHSHQHNSLATDSAFAANETGIRTVWIALAVLAATSVIQIVIYWLSGSVALFADTMHNIGDGLNSIPLLIAFYLTRRAPTRRYTYGFGRAEDVAGIFIVLSIAISAGIIFWESFQKLMNPQPLTNLGWLAFAAIVGFIGNETVAWFQIRVGRRIGSAAMIADGMHARTDGLTSLAVLIAIAGSWLDYPIVDPIIGLLIGVAILFITWDAIKTMWYRLMDAVEPEYIQRAEEVVRQQEGITELRWLRMRWLGHRLYAELGIAVDPHLSIIESHHIAEHLRHDLYHALNFLSEIMVHVDPWSAEPQEHHELTAHHVEKVSISQAS